MIIGGKQLEAMSLEDMVFQATIWEPLLWNAFYPDSRQPVSKVDFQENIFVKELNAWKQFSAGTTHETRCSQR